jgi:Ca-activated chloride channel family protein
MKRWTWVAFSAVCAALCGACNGASSDESAPSGKANDNSGNIPVGSATGGSSGYYNPGGSGKAASSAQGPYEGDPHDSSAAGASAEQDDRAVPPTAPPATNPFVMTEHDPLSTFAADIDTASYDIFARYVSEGMLPPADMVRLEEFVNYFHYGYEPPEPNAEHPFKVALAAAPSLSDPATLLLRVGIQGRLPSPEKRPANLVFLVDVSGSMQSSDKLPLVQYTLLETLSVLDPTDTVSIVTYASDTSVRLRPTPVAEASAIERAIEGLTAEGSTNGGSGIELAYRQAEAALLEGGINHVLLCTDGDFNLGLTSTQDLLELIGKKRKSGVTLTALGYGTGLNDYMMNAVSNAGNGSYSVIHSREQAAEYVENRFLSSLDFIAKDMKIQVEFNADKIAAYRLLGYETRAVADKDFRNDAVDAGEVGAGHRVTALYQLVPKGVAVPQPARAPEPESGAAYAGDIEVSADDYVLVKIRYKNPGASETDPAFEVAQSLGDAGIAEGWEALDADFQWALAIASFAEVLKQSPYATRDVLPNVQQIAARPVHRAVAERKEFARLLDLAIGLMKP